MPFSMEFETVFKTGEKHSRNQKILYKKQAVLHKKQKKPYSRESEAFRQLLFSVLILQSPGPCPAKNGKHPGRFFPSAAFPF